MWNETEIYLYLFRHNLHINEAYRKGMTRVGCLVCPFASEWNEMIAFREFHDCIVPFEKKLRMFAQKAGVQDVEDYIREGGWKRRAGGNFVDSDSRLTFISNSPKLVAYIKNPKFDILTYLWTVGEYRTSEKKGVVHGELKVKGNLYDFTIKRKDEKNKTYEFVLENIYDATLIGHIKRALQKSTYCIQCEACEVECPTGALSVYPKVKIEQSRCIHCGKCLDFHERGCIVANSLIITTNLKMNNKVPNIDRYKNFGLKEEWLDMYLIDLDDYWTGSHGLNENYQIPALKCWLKDAGIIDDKCKVTELGKFLAEFRMDRPELIWEIIWINLTYGSFIANWFANNIEPNSNYSGMLMEEQIRDQFPIYKEKTIHNAVYQIIRTLKESPIGETFSQCNAVDKSNYERGSYVDLSDEAIAYSLYKIKENKGVLSLRIADFYEESAQNGPFREFGVSKSVIEKSLRSLNSLQNRVLIAELNTGLDNITLREDLDCLSALKILLA